MILAGKVQVDGHRLTKAGAPVSDSCTVTIDTPDHPWVGRGGIKLAHAFDVFGLSVAGRLALDIGASTGGFTDVLLSKGAARVVAIDVGTGQLDWRLRSDPRVVSMEQINARTLRPEMLPAQTRRFALVTIDVSFISLAHILPVVPPLLDEDGRVLALVKPQFEAGRDQVGAGGIVRDPAVHEQVIANVTDTALRVGLHRIELEPSPITGAEGNREFLMLLARHAA